MPLLAAATAEPFGVKAHRFSCRDARIIDWIAAANRALVLVPARIGLVPVVALMPLPKETTMTDTANLSQRTRKTRVLSAPQPATAPSSKLDQLAGLLARDGGATIADLTSATGWQQQSVRCAIAGALKKRGLVITSEKVDGLRRYRASAAQ